MYDCPLFPHTKRGCYSLVGDRLDITNSVTHSSFRGCAAVEADLSYKSGPGGLSPFPAALPLQGLYTLSCKTASIVPKAHGSLFCTASQTAYWDRAIIDLINETFKSEAIFGN